MDTTLVWLIAGFLLVIVELVTGTFYLLVLGIAAFAGGATAYLKFGLLAQAIVSVAVAVAGIVWVVRIRGASAAVKMRSLDVGQTAAFDHWVDRSTGQARVKYRDALWDATVTGEAAGAPGETLYITAIDGNALKVSKTRPA